MKKKFAVECISCFVGVLVFSILMIGPPETTTADKKFGVVLDKNGEPQSCVVCHR